MKRPKSKPKDQAFIDWNHDGFVEPQREVDHYPEQARQHFDSVRALQLKNEAAGYYTLHDAAIRLAQAHGKTAEWWRSRMCADWLQGRLKMRDGSAWMTIDPPARSTDPKNLSEWIAKAKFGPSGMHKLLDPHYPHPDSLDVVSASDLDEWLKPIGSTFSVPIVEPTSLVEPAVDFDMLATREQLISAFGAFTGLKASWFDNLRDRPGLMAARRVAGIGGRNFTRPLFCPHQVMQWLITKPRQGDSRKQLTPETGFRLLKSNFLKVYCQYQIGDPNSD